MHYIDEGTGDDTIVFAHGLLFSGEMFEGQIAHLKSRYRCIAFDHRGQGKSPVTKDGYDMDTLTDDAIRLIEDLGVAPVHFAGLSMGGFIGMRIAIKRPDLLKSLILLDTSAEPEPEENKAGYRKLNFIGRWFGFGIVVNKVMPIVFAKPWRTDPARADERARWAAHIRNNDRKGMTRAVNGVIDREGVADKIDRITTPTLIIVGEEDTATVPDKARRIQAKIAGSELVLIPRAGHSSTIEEPAAVNAAIGAFLERL